MILFNLSSMFIQYLFNKDSWALHHSNFPIEMYTKKSELVAKNFRQKYVFSASRPKNEYKYNYRIPQNFTNKQLVSPSFLAKLINRYWQETILLSISTPLSDNYMNQLKSNGITVYQNKYKKFLLDFSKALTTGRIETSLDNSDFSNNLKTNPNYVKYLWRKGLNFSLSNHVFTFFSNSKYNNLSRRQQSILIKKIKDNDFPVFTIVNGFSQIVMAESSEQMLDYQNLLDKLYQSYYNRFLWKKNNKPTYEGLFFMNPEDALEYKHYIKQKYPHSAKQNHLNVFASKLELYYKLMRIRIPKAQFRLIPDLKELGELIYKYRKYRHIGFHHQQRYGKNHFQGQPIYMIQPLFAYNKKFKKVMPIKYFYKFVVGKDQTEYETIFMNYKTALLAWQKFKKQAAEYDLPYYPQILVYNLEDFIKTCEANKEIDKRNILFVPPKESYDFLKKRHHKQSKVRVLDKFSISLLHLKVFSKRILWSLTSRQPMVW